MSQSGQARLGKSVADNSINELRNGKYICQWCFKELAIKKHPKSDKYLQIPIHKEQLT